MIKRRHLLYSLSMLPLLSLVPKPASAFWPIFLRIILRGMVRAGSRSATKEMLSKGAARSATRNLTVRSGASVQRYHSRAPQASKNKLPTALEAIVEEAVNQTVSAAVLSEYEVPDDAPMCVVGEKNIKFDILAINNSNQGQACKFDFYLYDIDAKEVESLIHGPFGYLQAKSHIQATLHIPEMLYPGRKILVTNQDNTDTRVSNVFYSIESDQ